MRLSSAAPAIIISVTSRLCLCRLPFHLHPRPALRSAASSPPPPPPPARRPPPPAPLPPVPRAGSQCRATLHASPTPDPAPSSSTGWGRLLRTSHWQPWSLGSSSTTAPYQPYNTTTPVVHEPLRLAPSAWPRPPSPPSPRRRPSSPVPPAPAAGPPFGRIRRRRPHHSSTKPTRRPLAAAPPQQARPSPQARPPDRLATRAPECSPIVPRPTSPIACGREPH